MLEVIPGNRQSRSTAVEPALTDVPAHHVSSGLDWENLDASAHFAQFYESEAFLLASLCGYVATGLAGGEGVLVVATQPHLERMQQLLLEQDIALAKVIDSGQLTCLDAASTLAQFQVGSSPDAKLFDNTIGSIVSQKLQNHPKLRVFGEMVALLWNDGNYAGALALETLWNDLQKRHAFLLFCGYPISAAANEEFTNVCAEHSLVIPAESYVSLNNPDDRTKAIIRLQQHASVLQSEIAERKQAEQTLQRLQSELEMQVRDLRRLHEMSSRLASTLDVDSVLRQVLHAAMAVQGTTMGLLSLCNTPAQELYVAVHAGFDEEFLKRVETVPIGEGSCGTCFKIRQRVIVEDVELESVMAGYRAGARKAGFRACHSTPLITRSGTIIGVLSVHFKEPHRPTDREMQLMDLYAQMAADVIENARLHRRVQEDLAEREQVLARELIARAEAETANRMKDEFLANVSHELRTPLNAIIGWSHMLKTGKLDCDSVRRALETIERNAKVQAQLVEDILDVSRVITGKLQLSTAPVDLAAVINSSVDSVQLAAESKNIQLEVTLSPAARHTVGDAARLQQIVWNLLSNAIKFTPNHGRVQVRLERKGSHVRITVSDTGQGIPLDFLPFIFDRFRQADGTSTRRHGGLGLGLAIVRHLVELHGGIVSADSNGEGQGATFTVELPLIIPQNGNGKDGKAKKFWTKAAVEPEIKLPSLAQTSVLIIDNDPDTLNVLAVLLRDLTAEVESVSSVAEAMEVLKWFKPDVIVSDLAMPDEDGYSFITKIRQLDESYGPADLKRVPAVALTSYVRIEDRARALGAGFNMFVPKPVQPHELVNAIANLVHGSS